MQAPIRVHCGRSPQSREVGVHQYTHRNHARRMRSASRMAVVASAAASRSENGTDFVLPESKEHDDLDWVREAIVYQIFPDRFSRRPDDSDAADTQFAEWGSAPTLRGFQVRTQTAIR
eukprot:229680-Pyramimonas_sp.AAC.2